MYLWLADVTFVIQGCCKCQFWPFSPRHIYNRNLPFKGLRVLQYHFHWLKASRLLLNPTKTQLCGWVLPQQLAKVNVLVPVASTRINVSETARGLGVVAHWQSAVAVCTGSRCVSQWLRATTKYQLRQLRPLVRSMSAEAVKTLVQAFISCRLDYCISLFYGITEGLMSRLQSVQKRLHVWCRALNGTGTTTSRQCYRSCTDFQFDVRWISRWPSWSTCHCPAWPKPIWLPTAS